MMGLHMARNSMWIKAQDAQKDHARKEYDELISVVRSDESAANNFALSPEFVEYMNSYSKKERAEQFYLHSCKKKLIWDDYNEDLKRYILRAASYDN